MKKYTRIFTVIALVVICDAFLSMNMGWCKDGVGKSKELPKGRQRLMTLRDMINAEILREQNKIPSLEELGVERESLDRAIVYKKNAASAINRAIKEWPKHPGTLILRAKNLMQSAFNFENEDILKAAEGKAGTLLAQKVRDEAQEAMNKWEAIRRLLDELMREFHVSGPGGK